MNRYVMPAITTSYQGPNNRRGSRVLVRSQAGRSTHPYDDALRAHATHAAAARAHAERFGMPGRYIGGALHDGSYVFTRLAEDEQDTTEAFVVGGAS